MMTKPPAYAMPLHVVQVLRHVLFSSFFSIIFKIYFIFSQGTKSETRCPSCLLCFFFSIICFIFFNFIGNLFNFFLGMTIFCRYIIMNIDSHRFYFCFIDGIIKCISHRIPCVHDSLLHKGP
ncbi:Uncharacterized protein TCM_038409 [Theobroma cacao]|uniref:Uncharacterized protein n=1 Tax=Theobroma cacao TaxID=3641 RepID=A0A061GPY4_THECC|nr:Uncharacterized protein TCM_038409 [Theobroma cacao]